MDVLSANTEELPDSHGEDIGILSADELSRVKIGTVVGESDLLKSPEEESESDRIPLSQITALETMGLQTTPTPLIDLNSMVTPRATYGRWMEDNESSKCLLCNKRFGLFRRRHVSFGE